MLDALCLDVLLDLGLSLLLLGLLRRFLRLNNDQIQQRIKIVRRKDMVTNRQGACIYSSSPSPKTNSRHLPSFVSLARLL